MEEIFIKNIGGWTYIINPESNINKQDITGKYLWFCKNKKTLISLAKDILKKYGLLCAKVPSADIPLNTDFVLCVYDTEPKLKTELAKYSDDTIKYRYWKSDADTRRGIYSKKQREGK